MQGCFSQDILKNAVEDMKDCFAYFSTIRDKDGKILDFKLDYINRSGYESSYIKESEYPGKKLSKIEVLCGRSDCFNEYCDVIETGESLNIKSHICKDIYEKSYLNKIYDINASKYEDGLTLVWRETLDKGELNYSDTHEAIEANKFKNQFLANMSHELRTPLNSIIGFTNRVIKKCGNILPKVQLDNLIIVKEQAQHLLNLINSLLDYSKIQDGKMGVHREAFEIMGLLQEINSMMEGLIDGKTVKYKYELYFDKNMVIISDRIKIRQILINLLSNAVKFSDKGIIKLSIYEENKLCRIKVEDEGIGIAPQNIEYIFEEFRQIDGSYTRKAGGTGLGLTITKRFLDMLGGTIEVKSTLGEGSCFTVYIPMVMGETKIGRRESLLLQQEIYEENNTLR